MSLSTKEYVEYLIKNRSLLCSDLEQMKLQLEHLAKRGAQSAAGMTDRTTVFRHGASIYCEIQHRVNAQPYEQVKLAHDALQLELQRLDTAMKALGKRERDVLHCIYDLHMTWNETGSRLYISRNTVARSRARAMDFLTSCFEARGAGTYEMERCEPVRRELVRETMQRGAAQGEMASCV